MGVPQRCKTRQCEQDELNDLVCLQRDEAWTGKGAGATDFEMIAEGIQQQNGIQQAVPR